MKIMTKHRSRRKARRTGRQAARPRAAARPAGSRTRRVLGRAGAALRRHKAILRTWAIFYVWIGLFSAVATAGGFQGVYRLLKNLVAWITARTLTLFGHPAQATGEFVDTDSLLLEIIPACTGFLPTMLFLAAVFAYPCRWREKALGLAVGVTGIFLVNLVRVVSLYYVGIHFPVFFERVHILVWQPLVILSAVSLWLLWVVKLTRPDVPAAARASS